MKRAKYLFIGIIVSLGTLSVLGKNNFNTAGFGFFGFEEEEKMYTGQEVRQFVYDELIAPITACYTEAHPEVMMTKCPSRMLFLFDHRHASVKPEELVFSEHEWISGTVIFDDCFRESHVCSVIIIMNENKIVVKENFFTTEVSYEDFIQDFCSRVAVEKTK